MEAVQGIQRVEMTLPLEILKHDVPVDAGHVERLVHSIRQKGQLAPLYVWGGVEEQNEKQGSYQIIDGFHRTAAMRRLGLSEAQCYVAYCDEETFRDLRITSAVIHKSVTFARVVKWVRESFAETTWSQRMSPSTAFQGKWHLDGAEAHALNRWLRDKAELWGMSLHKIGEILEIADKISPRIIPHIRELAPGELPTGIVVTPKAVAAVAKITKDHDYQELALQKVVQEGLSATEAAELAREIVRKGENDAISDEEYKHFLDTPYRKVKNDRREAAWRAYQAQRDEKEAQRDPIGEQIVSTINALDSVAKRLDETIKNLPQYPDLQSSFQDVSTQVMNRLWRYHDLATDLQRARSENDVLKRQNNALRASLGLHDKINQDNALIRKDA
jgi:hypothetical protein